MNYPKVWKIVALVASQAFVPTVHAAGKPAAGGSYTVKTGDTFAKIARTKGIPLGELLKANRIANPDQIRMGQTIVIPGGKPAAAKTAAVKPPVKPVTKGQPATMTKQKNQVTDSTRVDVTPPAPRGGYIVKSGDTLSKIQRQTGVPAAQIARLNGLTGSSTIRIGQTLRLTTAAAVPPADTVALSTKNQRPAAPPQDAQVTADRQQPAATGTAPHSVQSGETFTSISRVYGVSSAQLAAANKNINPAKLRIGQTLMIPGQPVHTPAKPLQVRADGRVLADHPDPLTAGDFADTTVIQSRTRTGYLVQDGETIAEIAARFRCGEREIRQLNRMGATDNVYPGRYILVPFNRQAPLPGNIAQRDA